MSLFQRVGWIGVDVGTHTVKLAQVTRDGAVVRLHRAAVIQRPASWRGDDSLGKDQPITSTPEIRAALECGGFSGRDAVCTLPMNVCQMRGLNLPPGTDYERRTMASDELTEEWAEKKLSMEFDFWDMDSGQAASDAFNVNILAASRPWVAQIWHDCRQTGLDCWAVDGTPLAIARAVGLLGGASGGRRALAIDWGFSNTTLCLVGDDRPLYSRRIYGCAFGRMLEAVRERFSVSLEEAQHLIDTQGMTSSETGSLSGDQQIQAAITDATSEVLDELVRQLSRTLQFMETQRRHLQATGIWIMGGGASMRNIDVHLSNALKLPVHVWQMPPAAEAIPCARSRRGAMFGGAAALSALAWRAA